MLDNADDPTVDYQHYFPDGTLGVVIMTSRNPECQQYATGKSISLEGLSNKDAEELLLKAACVPPDQYSVHAKDAAEVANLLRSHPLALTQAGAYVSRGHCTLSEYPRIFEQHRERLLAFHSVQGQSRYRDVYATFEASAEILQLSQKEAEVDALQLLPVLAACGPNRLPLALFEAGWKGARSVPTDSADDDDLPEPTTWHVSRLLPLMQADSDRWDSFRLIEAIHMLKALSLVSTDDYDGVLSISMHPLIHAWARDRQNMAEQHKSWIATGCLFAMLDRHSELWLRIRWQLQPHVQALTGWDISKIFASEPLRKVTTIIVRCGELLHDMRDDAKLFNLVRSLLNHLGLDPCTIHMKWVDVYELTAENLHDLGRVKQAVSLLEQLVKFTEQSAINHPDRLKFQHGLAGAIIDNGQVREGVSLLEHVVKIREQTLAEDHRSRLGSQHELAAAYLENAQVKEAVALLEHVVKIRNQVLAEDHPHRLGSQHELASAYEKNGQVKEAILLLEHVVKIQEQLAEDHPSRLASEHELAGAYLGNGQVEEAVTLLEHVVRIQEQLAEDDPNRLSSEHELARAYRKNKQITKAIPLLEHVVRIREQVLAEDHPYRLTSEHLLATMYWDCGRRNSAVQMMRHVVEIYREVLDEHHPERVKSEGWLEMMERKMNKEKTRKEKGKKKDDGKEKKENKQEEKKEKKSLSRRVLFTLGKTVNTSFRPRRTIADTIKT